MAKISIIIPIYNSERYLSRCIQSVLNQTFSDFELVLINDGSIDESGKICDEFKEMDKRIHVIHQENKGVACARNVGLDWCFKYSHSEWITFIDSDDWVSAYYLETLYEPLIKTSLDLSISEIKKTKDETKKFHEISKEFSIVTPRDVYMQDDMTASVPTGKLYAKKLFRNIRYPVGKIHEDEFVTYKILFQVEKIVRVFEEIYAYYQHDSSITNVAWSMARLDKLEALEE